jgi:uncharacterized hydrophobic protein (TIGR00271 family)
VSEVDVARMRDQLFFEGTDLGRRLSRFWLLLTLAAVIASAGVITDSTATVIGAMIVAPLMVPILGTVVAVVLGDRANLLRSLALVTAGAVSVVLIGYVLGLFIDLPVVAATNSQVASRVTPDLMDLVAALATGAVGSIALARDDISDTLPGVAIAISLVPPLAVVGLTLESGAPDQSFGALLLFLTNVSAILASGLLVMAVYRVHHHVTVMTEGGPRTVRRGRASVVIILGLIVIAFPLAIVSAHVNSIRTTQASVSDVAQSWAAGHGWSVVAVDSQPGGVLVRVTGSLPEPDTASLQAALANAGLSAQPVQVELIPSHTVRFGPS